MPTWHAARAACLALALASPVRAQTPASDPAEVGFLSRYDFQLMAVALGNDDPRFSWDARLGGDVDVADYGTGRITALAEYEVVLGDELRPFDTNQAYYRLEVSASYRRGAAELAGVFQHVSRHLSDRPKSFAIAWNVVGVRVSGRMPRGRTAFDWRGEAGWVTQHAHVDYRWTGSLDLAARRTFGRRLGVFARGAGELYGVEGTIAGRGTQLGGRIEAGLQLTGAAAVLELFAGVERRVDGEPIELQPRRWTLAGFRLLSK